MLGVRAPAARAAASTLAGRDVQALRAPDPAASGGGGRGTVGRRTPRGRARIRWRGPAREASASRGPADRKKRTDLLPQTEHSGLLPVCHRRDPRQGRVAGRLLDGSIRPVGARTPPPWPSRRITGRPSASRITRSSPIRATTTPAVRTSPIAKIRPRPLARYSRTAMRLSPQSTTPRSSQARPATSTSPAFVCDRGSGAGLTPRVARARSARAPAPPPSRRASRLSKDRSQTPQHRASAVPMETCGCGRRPTADRPVPLSAWVSWSGSFAPRPRADARWR